tara:strand:+ start:2535 stop:3170 length:636 start_codon:yes stop_codon:yes gene_type:complete
MKETENIIQLIIYKIAFKVSLVFKLLKLTPNQITLVSFLLSFISCFFLLNNKVTYFIIFWYASHFLDYCDGTLSRITNNKTKILLRVDHFCDLIKISLIFTFISLYYSIIDIWLLNTFFLVIFFISQLLSNEFTYQKKILNEKNPSHQKKRSIFKEIYNIFFTFDGHTLFIIGLMFISTDLTRIIYAYLILLCIKTLITPLKFLLTNMRKS